MSQKKLAKKNSFLHADLKKTLKINKKNKFAKFGQANFANLVASGVFKIQIC